MDIFSKSVLSAIIKRFPELRNKQNQLSNFLELDIASTNNSALGGLVIQTTADKDIWIRNYHKYSAYFVDATDELIEILEGIFANQVLWVISFSDNEWIETTLISKDADVKVEKGVTYIILSWSGESDIIYQAD